MSYKGVSYLAPSCIHLQEKIKDVLVAAGWTLVGPSTDLASRQAQDDEHAHILGWFLHSTGESGNDDLHLHLGRGRGLSDSGPCNVKFSYLTADVTDPDATTMAVKDGSKFTNSNPFKIGDELCMVGTVVGNTLTGLTRGYGGTTKATHSTDDVAINLSDGVTTLAYHDMFAFRDLENPIKASTGTANALVDSMAAVPGYSGWGLNRFRKSCLAKIRGGAEDGKMRFVKEFNDAGDFEYQEFLNAPGTVDLDVISAGWFPIPASRVQKLGTYAYYKSGVMTYVDSYSEAGQSTWICASKDGFAVVALYGTDYYPYYAGRYIPSSSPEKTTMNLIGGGDIPAGTQTVEVANVDLFVVGGKLRTLSQDYRDWTENQDRSADTFMGASPGDWDDLDPDETVHEDVIVDSINVGSSQVTFTQPLLYGYRSGAVIGEDPVPICIHSHNNGNYVQFKPTNYSTVAVFHAVPKSVVNATNPSHRRRDRCGTYGATSPWLYDGGRDAENQLELAEIFMNPAMIGMMDNEENYSDALPLSSFTLTYRGSNNSATNAWKRAYGIIPLVRKSYSGLGATSEDTVKILWNGKYETFRLFYNSVMPMWFVVGPEIAL